jgi:predicted HTH domain antitoxin
VASKPYPLRIPENLLSLVDSKAKEDRIDRSTALRQLLYAGAEDYVLELLKLERISVSRAAELLDVSVYKVRELMRERGVGVSPTLEDYNRGQEVASRLLD